ncbi:MAG: PilZ domain-containing protein [Candidatus Methylomirabilales bacterium]
MARFLKLGMLEHGPEAGRGFPRLGIQLSVDFQPLKTFTAGTSFDLSVRGVFVRTTQSLSVGQDILVRFMLPGVGHAFKVMGRVVWSSPTDTAKGYPAGMGIQFVGLSPEEQGFIEGHLVDTLLDRALAREPER